MKNKGSGGKHRVWSVKNTGSDGKQWVRWNTQRLVSEKHRVWLKTLGLVENTTTTTVSFICMAIKESYSIAKAF